MPEQAQQFGAAQGNTGSVPFPGAPQQGTAYGAASGQMANQVINSSKNIFREIGNLFKDPIGTTVRIADENKMTMPLIMVITNIVVIFLLAVICMLTVRIRLGEYSSWLSIPYVKIVLVMTILSAIFDFALAGALMLSVKVFFKEETSFAKMLALVGTKVLLDSIFIIAGVILAMISAPLGTVVIGAGMVFTSLIFIMSFQKLSALSDTKKFYALFAAVIMQVVVMAIVYAVIARSVLGGLSSALSYFV